MKTSLGRTLRLLFTATLLAGSCAACDRSSAPEALIRVDQVGYAPGETKIAYLLSPRDAADVQVTVVDADGKDVLSPKVGANRGPWNTGFPDVRPIDLSGLSKHSVYRVRVTGAVRAESPPFHIEQATDLFRPLTSGSLEHFQNHRDGADQVPSVWQRQPAHLADRAATIYARPAFDASGRLTAGLQSDGGPVDVEGGWFDAGDFLKFTHTTAYALGAMLIAQRRISANTEASIDFSATGLLAFALMSKQH